MKQEHRRWTAGYLRVSTEMQVERDALANQEQALTSYCQVKGLELRLYRDEGISAKDVHRPELQRLLSDVRTGSVSTVLVTKLDRISRSLHDLLDLTELFEERSVQFVSLRDNIDTSGPVGRFILHILGAIAELERGITAERVAEDMKLRARRGKWNGGMVPYGRTLVEGRLGIVPEEAANLRYMRDLLKEKRSWRGVVTALNREGSRTRGWEPVEVNGRVVRKGKPPAEWTAVTLKRVLLQPINEGTLVYNRRQARGRTHVPRPEEEHIVVEGFCEPIFTREEMVELMQIAAEIEGEPPRTKSSEYLLSGLIHCACGAKMYAVRNYVQRKDGRRAVVYYRCRRATDHPEDFTTQVAAAIVEPAVLSALCQLSLSPDRLAGLLSQAETQLQEAIEPLRQRWEGLARQRVRLQRRERTLLEMAEDGLLTKQEFAARRAALVRLQRAAAEELANAEKELRAGTDGGIDVGAALASLSHLQEVYEELEQFSEKRRLLQMCIDRLVIRPGILEVDVSAHSSIVLSADTSPS